MNITKYVLEKKCSKTGFAQRIIYTGSLRSKPLGWRMVEVLR